MSINSEANQALLQSHEEAELELKLQSDERQPLKSYEILKYAAKIITSKIKFFIFMIFSLLPFYVFMVFYEIKLPKLNDSITEFLIPISLTYSYDYNNGGFDIDENEPIRRSFRVVLELFPFYLLLLPFLELLSLPIIINLASKIYKGDTINRIFYQKNDYNKGVFVTFLWVQVLSTSTLIGLFWTIVNHHFITLTIFTLNEYGFVKIISMFFHALIFVALLYKYLDWSSNWNMAMVISNLEKDTGVVNALEISAYYGKHCKRLGFELMLIYLVYIIVLRVPFLVARISGFNVGDLATILIVAGLVCLGSLMKWVAFMLYFYGCKAQVLSKKVDEEEGKVVKSGDLC